MSSKFSPAIAVALAAVLIVAVSSGYAQSRTSVMPEQRMTSSNIFILQNAEGIVAPVMMRDSVDSTSSSARDSVKLTIGSDGFGWAMTTPTRPYVFAPPDGRQVIYREAQPFMDFNRVTGYYLGLSTGSMQSFGPHDELGVDAALGYGFESSRWEYLLGAEARLPLGQVPSDSTQPDSLRHPAPTLAIGGEFHNITSTADDWRDGRLENALFAFFAREDFRNYYKLAGWNAYVAYRPSAENEVRLGWRSDHYQSLPQTVFYGRWGGDKVLPPNPAIVEGQMNSMVLSVHHEHARTRAIETVNLFGDSVWCEQMCGISLMGQAEFAHMPASDFGFNRYVLDVRNFWPVIGGISLDARFRYEAEVGDVPLQKLSYFGGPGTLPAEYRFSLVGNRMLLLNTEIRIHPPIISSWFSSSDIALIVFNDFGKLGFAQPNDGVFGGFGFSGASSIDYNVGVGFGWTHGVQVGVTWPTNYHGGPRLILRLQRAF